MTVLRGLNEPDCRPDQRQLPSKAVAAPVLPVGWRRAAEWSLPDASRKHDCPSPSVAAERRVATLLCRTSLEADVPCQSLVRGGADDVLEFFAGHSSPFEDALRRRASDSSRPEALPFLSRRTSSSTRSRTAGGSRTVKGDA